MTTIWVIADTHFRHHNIYKFMRADGVTLVRPEFDNAEQADDAMIENWNARVKPQDHVYHLGDVCMRANDLWIVKKLNGHKRLVRGNHDIFKTRVYLAHGFEEIHGVRKLANMWLTHFPVHPLSMGKCIGNVHGHIHEKVVPSLKDGQWGGVDYRYLNVGVEQPHMNYAPITLEECVALINMRTRMEVVNGTE